MIKNFLLKNEKKDDWMFLIQVLESTLIEQTDNLNDKFKVYNNLSMIYFWLFALIYSQLVSFTIGAYWKSLMAMPW